MSFLEFLDSFICLSFLFFFSLNNLGTANEISPEKFICSDSAYSSTAIRVDSQMIALERLTKSFTNVT